VTGSEVNTLFQIFFYSKILSRERHFFSFRIKKFNRRDEFEFENALNRCRPALVENNINLQMYCFRFCIPHGHFEKCIK
jgi:hypothetical protein